MDIELTIKNYRAFEDSLPARIVVRDGFTSFIGANNSGKSSLLKFFYEFRHLFSQLRPSGGDLSAVMAGGTRPINFPPEITDLHQLFSNFDFNDRNLSIQLDMRIDTGNAAQPDAGTALCLLISVLRGTNEWRAQWFLNGQKQGPDVGLAETRLVRQDQVVVDLAPFFEVTSVLASMFYIPPFRNAINVGANQSYFDIQVGTAFIDQWRVWKTGTVTKDREASHKLTADIQRIFGFREFDADPSSNGQTLVMLVDGKSYTMSDLGTGLAQFFLVLANTAIRRPSFVLIDEPELGLHASLQMDFLTTLASYARHGVIFATHSYGLSRASSDRIYTVRRDSSGRSSVSDLETTTRLPELLGELGFAAYKELGFDKVLLVEGPSELKTVQQFLRRYGRDHEVVLLPLHGKAGIRGTEKDQLAEITRISDHVYALIDSERAHAGADIDPDRRGFAKVCKKLDIDCRVLERRAMENYFTDRAIKRALGPDYSALGPYERLKDASRPWGKSENWRIAREMTKDELHETDLGRFLEEL